MFPNEDAPFLVCVRAFAAPCRSSLLGESCYLYCHVVQLVLEASEAKICNLTILGGASAPTVHNMCGDITLEGDGCCVYNHASYEQC